MTFVYKRRFGDGWLSVVASQKQSTDWSERCVAEAARVKRGVAAVPEVGLSYANFYDLLTIADKHWEELAPALDKKAITFRLLERFEQLRNSVAHGRPLLAFERDLLSGIAGQIRNQVTIFMSTQDDAGEYYPRIESITDSFGHRIDSAGSVDHELAGSQITGKVLRPGDVVTYTAIGTDPQDRTLRWRLTSSQTGRLLAQELSSKGTPVALTWVVDDGDVTETAVVQIHMEADGARYHRFVGFDHRAFFHYTVRPPMS